MKNIFKKKPKTTIMPATYITDDYEQAQNVSENFHGVSVQYHNPNEEPVPYFVEKINGIPYVKDNPAYKSYMKRKHPEMSMKEIEDYVNSLFQAEFGKEETPSQKSR